MNKKYVVWICLLFAAFVSLIPTFLRFWNKNTSFPADYSYYFLNSLGLKDALFIKISIVLLGFISMYLLYKILLKTTNVEIAFYSLIFGLISSPFIFLINTFSLHILGFFLIVLGFFFLVNERKIFAFICFFATLFLGISSLACLLFLLCYSASLNKDKILTAIFSLVVTFNLLISKIEYIPNLWGANFYVTEFGSIIGFGILFMIIGLIGFVLSWKFKLKFAFVYLSVFVFLLLSFKSIYMLIYLNIFVIVFFSFAFQKLVALKWELVVFKNLFFVILVFMLLFSSVTYGISLSNSEPSLDMISSLKVLKEDDAGNILSHYSYKNIIEYFSEKQEVNFGFSITPEIDYLYGITNIKESQKKFNEANVDYIFITEEMKRGLVWNYDDEGLLYLLPNKDLFALKYSENGYEIWKVK